MSTTRDDHQPMSSQKIELEMAMTEIYELMTSRDEPTLDDVTMKLAEASNNYFAFIEVCFEYCIGKKHLVESYQFFFIKFFIMKSLLTFFMKF